MGVDSVWEQRKLEARKMLENAAESPASSARFVSRLHAYGVDVNEKKMPIAMLITNIPA